MSKVAIKNLDLDQGFLYKISTVYSLMVNCFIISTEILEGCNYKYQLWENLDGRNYHLQLNQPKIIHLGNSCNAKSITNIKYINYINIFELYENLFLRFNYKYFATNKVYKVRRSTSNINGIDCMFLSCHVRIRTYNKAQSIGQFG